MIERTDENGDYLIVFAADGREFMINSADAGVLGDHIWRIYERNKHNHYVYRPLNSGISMIHREIMEAPKGMLVDHRDWNGLNCRRHNMRLVTLAQNTEYNKNRKFGKSGVRGAYQLPNGRYSSIARLRGKLTYLGVFDTVEEAGCARDAAILAARGEFAVLNYPQN